MVVFQIGVVFQLGVVHVGDVFQFQELFGVV